MPLEPLHRPDGSAETPTDMRRHHPSIALAPYVEALVVGRRACVLGDATTGLADALLVRGARLVHAYDPDRARVAEALARSAPAFGSPAAGRPAARGVVHAPLGDDLGVRDGAFDAVIIPDLSLFPDRTDIVRRAKKLCSHAGAVVVAAPNPDVTRTLASTKRRAAPAGERSLPALTYYELYDLLSLQFPFVRMVGQAPFVGYSIVAFAPDREPDVTFDASLMSGTEEPEIFVGIAGERRISTDAYLVVEVPAADILVPAALSAEPETRRMEPSSAIEELRGARGATELAEAKAHLVLMEAELENLRQQKVELTQKLESARRADGEAEARAKDAQREASEQAARWSALESRAGDEHVRAERLTHKVRDLEEELVRQRDRSQKLTKALDDEKRAKQKAEIELGMARGLPRGDEVSSVRAEELSGELARANARIEELSAELRQTGSRADGLAHELLAKSKETAELRREHEAAASRAGELSRSLSQAQKTIDELSATLKATQDKLADLEEDQVQTLRRPPEERPQVIQTVDVDSGVAAQIARLSAEASAEHQALIETKRTLEVVTGQRDAALAQVKKLEATLEEERTERKALVIAKSALEAEVSELQKRIEELSVEDETTLAPEVAELEAALRERGHRIANLERDLRESERIGRELIIEVMALRAAAEGADGGDDGPPDGSNTDSGQSGSEGGGPAQPLPEPQGAKSAVDPLTAEAFQHRIDALAADAAQKQAELLTAALQIQALTRQLEEARLQVTDPSQAHQELAAALVRAQAEIAELRQRNHQSA